ncbi:hypothetical protein BDV12DRAFT_159421 [Aspergillus spectabilis]
MKHIRGLLTPTQALRQIFLVPQTLPRTQPFRYVPAQPSSQIRLASWGASRRQQDQITDKDIRAEYVQIVNAENKLDPPVRLRDALNSINRPDQFLLQVSPGSLDTPAICRVMNSTVVRQHTEQKVKAARAAKASLKTLELNWAIDPHDLSHRLKQLLNFMEKGRTVEIILKRKKGKRAPTVEEVKALMDKVLQVVRDADAIQVDPMEGVPGKQVTLVVKKKDA